MECSADFRNKLLSKGTVYTPAVSNGLQAQKSQDSAKLPHPFPCHDFMDETEFEETLNIEVVTEDDDIFSCCEKVYDYFGKIFSFGKNKSE